MHSSAAKKNRQSTDILERLKNEYNYILHEVLTSTVSFKQLKFLLRFLITNSTPPSLEWLLGRGL
jgi:flagellar biosynthesis component FlhA